MRFLAARSQAHARVRGSCVKCDFRHRARTGITTLTGSDSDTGNTSVSAGRVLSVIRRIPMQPNARRLSYMKKFGLRKADLGVTLHGLRHEVASNEFERLSGVRSAIRGGNSPLRGEPRASPHDVSEGGRCARLCVGTMRSWYVLRARPRCSAVLAECGALVPNCC